MLKLPARMSEMMAELRERIDSGRDVVLAPAAIELVQIAQRAAPKESKSLEESISAHVEGDSIVLTASAPHALYVQQGTRHQDAQPFMPIDRSGDTATTTHEYRAWWEVTSDDFVAWVMGGAR